VLIFFDIAAQFTFYVKPTVVRKRTAPLVFPQGDLPSKGHPVLALLTARSDERQAVGVHFLKITLCVFIFYAKPPVVRKRTTPLVSFG
jgi:hypothetical protein